MRKTSFGRRRVWPFVLFTAIWSMSTSRAAAQSTLGLVPEPIVAAQLDLYSSRLHLSPQQQIAVADMQLKYAAEYRTLREGDIQKFMTELGKLSMSLSESHKRLTALSERVRSLDNQFFDQIGTILSDQQAAILPAVRAMRERDCLTHNSQIFLARRPCDLSVLLQQANLDDGEQAAVAERLAQYEIAMASLLRELANDSDLLMAKQLKACVDAGLPDHGQLTDAQKETEYAVGRQFNDERNEHYRDAFSRTRAVNRDACRDLCALLSPTSSRVLRNAFFGSDYNPNLKRTEFGDVIFEQIVAGRELDATQKAAVAAAIEDYNRALDAAIATMADEFDDYYRRFSPVAGASGGAGQEDFRKAMTGSTAALMDVRTSALKSVEAILGEAPEQAQALVDPIAGEIDVDYRNVARVSGASIMDDDALLPGPMSAAEFAVLGEALKLDATVVETIRQHYQDRYAQLDAGALGMLRRATKRLDETRTPGAPHLDQTQIMEIVNATLNSRRASLQAIVAVDDGAFIEFRDAAGVKDDDQRLQRARDARTRARCNRATYGGKWDRYGPGARNDAMIDLAYLLRRRQPAIARQPVVDGMLIEYERILTPLMVSKYDLLVAVNELCERDRSDLMRSLVAAGRPDPGINYAARRVQLAPQQCQAIGEINDRIAELNQQTVKLLAAALPAESAFRLQRDFDRLAFPRVFYDPSCAAPTLARALKLKEMPPPQRTQLEQLAADYNTTYDDLCRKMMAAVEKVDSLRYNPATEDTADFRQRYAELSQRETLRLRLAFDRNELNVRTINRLKAILSEEQRKAMGGLPATPVYLAIDYGY